MTPRQGLEQQAISDRPHKLKPRTSVQGFAKPGHRHQIGTKTHSFGVPSGIPDGSVRTALSEPFGAACMPGGLSPWGLEAGAPPVVIVLIGPVLPCGCPTLPLGLAVVDGSSEFVCERAAVEPDSVAATANMRILMCMVGTPPGGIL